MVFDCNLYKVLERLFIFFLREGLEGIRCKGVLLGL